MSPSRKASVRGSEKVDFKEKYEKYKAIIVNIKGKRKKMKNYWCNCNSKSYIKINSCEKLNRLMINTSRVTNFIKFKNFKKKLKSEIRSLKNFQIKFPKWVKKQKLWFLKNKVIDFSLKKCKIKFSNKLLTFEIKQEFLVLFIQMQLKWKTKL